MTQRNKHRKRSSNSPASQTQRSSIEQEASEEHDLSNFDGIKAVQGCIRLLLNTAQSNWSLVKRSDIVKHALLGQGRHFNIVVDQAAKQLKKVYNYELCEVEVDVSKPNAQKYYYLKRIADENGGHYNNGFELSNEHKHIIILRYLIMLHLQLSGGSCSEENLMTHLAKMTIIPEVGVHEKFGSVTKQITDFVRQHYLDEKLVSDKKVYHIGQRGKDELKADSYFMFVERVNEGFLNVSNDENEETVEY